MIELKNNCIGVRCPVCGKNFVDYINKFQFASGTEVFCPYCEAPILSIKKRASSDNFTLNCFACGETHKYSVSAKSFFSGTPASYGCKVNAVDVLYTGSHEDVDMALSTLSDELNRLTDKYYDNMEKLYGSCSAAAIRILEEKARERRIICLCGSYEMNLNLSDGGIYLTCPQCGGSEFIPVATEDDVKALMERRSILVK